MGGNNLDMPRLYANLLWPAVAGNVLWALMTMIVDSSPGASSPYDFLVILVLAAYLVGNWVRTAAIGRHEPKWECKASEVLKHLHDFLHILLMAGIAISVGADQDPQVFIFTACFLGVTGLGHAFGRDAVRTYKPFWCCILAVFGIGMAIAVFCLRPIAVGEVRIPQTNLTPSVALVVMLVVWIGANTYGVKKKPAPA